MDSSPCGIVARLLRPLDSAARRGRTGGIGLGGQHAQANEDGGDQTVTRRLVDAVIGA
ncbi:hypothetical protein ACFVVM_24850 [Nocardia sp. NPDC058176]|uniref:hypothetical protein n=1 Tax=Nocardia sp. NPDC058176 TaxID=3346368 RepID=UPI0036D878D1